MMTEITEDDLGFLYGNICLVPDILNGTIKFQQRQRRGYDRCVETGRFDQCVDLDAVSMLTDDRMVIVRIYHNNHIQDPIFRLLTIK